MAGYDPVARQQATAAATTANQALALAQAAQVVVTGWQVVNSNAAPVSGAQLSVDTSVQPVTITLPASGGAVSLRDNAGTWGTNPVTVVSLSAPFAIDGADTFLLDEPGFQVNFAQVNGAWLYTLAYLYGAA